MKTLNQTPAASAQAQHKKQQFDFKADLTKEAPAGKSFKDVAQAQHSDLAQKLKIEQQDHQRCAHKLVKEQTDLALARQMCHIESNRANKAEAHAQRLADALTNLTGRAVTGLHQDATHDGLVNCEAIARAREALADWSKSI
jgi:hypothetical protein